MDFGSRYRLDAHGIVLLIIGSAILTHSHRDKIAGKARTMIPPIEAAQVQQIEVQRTVITREILLARMVNWRTELLPPPTLEEIAEECRAIRATWTEADFRERATGNRRKRRWTAPQCIVTSGRVERFEY